MFKNFLKYIKNPHLIFLIISYLGSIVLAVLSIVLAFSIYNNYVLTYLVYALATVFLTYTVYRIILVVPTLRDKIHQIINSYEFTKKIANNYDFRTIVFSIQSCFFNIVYALFNGYMAIKSSSIWYISLAGYYIVLAIIRFGVVYFSKKVIKKQGNNLSKKKIKQKIFLGTGISLLVLEIALSVAVVQMVASRKPFLASEIFAIATAVYAFLKITFAIINLFRAKNFQDPIVQSLRNINLTDALVSILALQVTLLAVFDNGSMKLLNSLTGTLICVIVIFIGIFMILKGKKAILQEKRKNE